MHTADTQWLFTACTAPSAEFRARIEAQLRADARHARIIAMHPDPQGWIDSVTEQAWEDALREAS